MKHNFYYCRMAYLAPDFWEQNNAEKRQIAQDAAIQNDKDYLTTNHQIDLDILHAQKNLYAKESACKNETFKLWKAKKGFM